MPFFKVLQGQHLPAPITGNDHKGDPLQTRQSPSARVGENFECSEAEAKELRKDKDRYREVSSIGGK